MLTEAVLVTITIPEAISLKDKRQVKRRIIDHIRHTFNAAIAEVATQDDHQILMLGIAVVSNHQSHTREMLETILRDIEQRAEIIAVVFQ